MAAHTPAEVKNRLLTLWGLVAGVTTSIDDYPEDGQAFEDAELVVAITRLGQATNTAISGRSFVMTRQVSTHLIVSRVEASQHYPDTSALEATEAYMVSVPLFFAARPQLQNPATGLAAYVRNMTLPSERDPGAGRFAFGGVDYYGLLFDYQIETVHTS